MPIDRDNQGFGDNKLETLKKSDRQVYELIHHGEVKRKSFAEFHADIFDVLKTADSQVYDLISREHRRQQNTLQLIAAENQCSKAVLAALGNVVQNKTTEGMVGSRYHAGCEVVDRLESLAIERAKKAFDAKYANVQPHCGTSANQIVLTAILEKDDKILSLGLDQGGHVSHGGKISWTGKFFDVENYYVDRESFLLDYEAIRAKAIAIKPKLIICGATAYSRIIDFAKFREIADHVGAYLLADVSHIAGLIIAGVHPSPVDYAHFTTTSTYKPGGPRGGLILMGKDHASKIQTASGEKQLWELIDKATFPGVQGTPYLNHIAAKAVFFKETLSDEYRDRQFRIVENAKSLSSALKMRGCDVLTSGIDNHMVLINVANFKEGLTGIIAQKALEDCGIVVNMNKIAYDSKGASVTSGIRFGTPIVTRNGMGIEQMEQIAEIIDLVLRSVEIINEKEYRIAEPLRELILQRVDNLCGRFEMR